MIGQISSSRARGILPICALLSVALLVHQNKHSLQGISIGDIIASPLIPGARAHGRYLTDESSVLEVEQLVGEDGPLPPHAPPTLTLSQKELAPYSLSNVLETLPFFHDTFAVIVYDPPSDKFIAHYSNNMRWISGCHKLITSFKIVANSLRTLFPDRFTSDSPEFALSISSADYPGIKWNECFRNQNSDCIPKEVQLSPVLQFGSVFRLALLPTMIPMPMPQMNQLSCFHYYALHHEICDLHLPRTPENPKGLVFGETIGLNKLEDLIPQVVWRGTDFSYLHKMKPSLRPPNFEMDVTERMDQSDRVDQTTAAIGAIKEVYDELIPRWKGVVWTAEAERENDIANNRFVIHKNFMNGRGQESISQNENQGEQVPIKKLRAEKARAERALVKAKEAVAREHESPSVPWANIKFAGAMYMGQKLPTSSFEYYQQFEEYGIPAIGEGMSLEELGRYRYHIDLGGGGGTTWSGTLEKLGLPGLLFHHITPTKDYLHDIMKPWVHYVPVKEDLSDLHDKFIWAESHPKMAQSISDNATQLAKSFGTLEGMEVMFRQYYEEPLRHVVEAYRPLKKGKDWKQVMTRMVGDELRPIMACGGYHHHVCDRLVDDIDFDRLDVVEE